MIGTGGTAAWCVLGHFTVKRIQDLGSCIRSSVENLLYKLLARQLGCYKRSRGVFSCRDECVRELPWMLSVPNLYCTPFFLRSPALRGLRTLTTA